MKCQIYTHGLNLGWRKITRILVIYTMYMMYIIPHATCGTASQKIFRRDVGIVIPMGCNANTV